MLHVTNQLLEKVGQDKIDLDIFDSTERETVYWNRETRSNSHDKTQVMTMSDQTPSEMYLANKNH